MSLITRKNKILKNKVNISNISPYVARELLAFLLFSWLFSELQLFLYVTYRVAFRHLILNVKELNIVCFYNKREKKKERREMEKREEEKKP